MKKAPLGLFSRKITEEIHPEGKPRDVHPDRPQKEEAEKKKKRKKPHAAEGGAVTPKGGTEGGDLVKEERGKNGGQAGVKAERAEGVGREEAVEGARHATGRAVKPDEVKWASKPRVEEVTAIQKEKDGERRYQQQVNEKIKKKRLSLQLFEHSFTPLHFHTICVTI